MSVVRDILRGAQVLVPRSVEGMVVLALHLVDGGTDSPVDLPRSQFRDFLDELAATADVLPAIALGTNAPAHNRPRVLLTVDDAYANFAENIWPELARRKLTCLLYVPTGFIDGDGPPPLRGARLPPLSWSALRALAADGVVIGSHSVRHDDLRALDPLQLDEELHKSRHRLEDELQREVGHFCYPRALWNARTDRHVRRVYATATIAGGRRTLSATSRWRIPRHPLHRGLRALDPVISRVIACDELCADAFRRIRTRH